MTGVTTPTEAAAPVALASICPVPTTGGGTVSAGTAARAPVTPRATLVAKGDTWGPWRGVVQGPAGQGPSPTDKLAAFRGIGGVAASRGGGVLAPACLRAIRARVCPCSALKRGRPVTVSALCSPATSGQAGIYRGGTPESGRGGTRGTGASRRVTVMAMAATGAVLALSPCLLYGQAVVAGTTGLLSANGELREDGERGE